MNLFLSLVFTIFGIAAGAVIATYFTIKAIMKSNDLGDSIGSFWDYRGKLNVIEEVSDLDAAHPYVDAKRIFREHLAERKVALRKAALEAKKAGGQAAR